MAYEVVKTFDCSCIEGHRGEDAQDAAFYSGLSQLAWPASAHNATPSRAMHLVPYPIDWHDRDRFHYFAGFVRATALQRFSLNLRFGGDWDNDWETRDNAFDDLAHWELL